MVQEHDEHRPSGGAEASSSLDKALRLFSVIIQDRGATPLGDLAELDDLPVSTRHRLLEALARHGLVSRVGHGRYDVAASLAQALRHVSARDQLVRCARPPLRRLARACNLTAHLGILEQEMVTYLVKETGRSGRSAAPFSREGGQLEAYCSGIGKVLLAYSPVDYVARYLAESPLVSLTERTIIDPVRLREQLVDIRAAGFAIDDGEIAEDLYCIAAPVATPGGDVIAAISISMHRDKAATADRPALIGKLRECARALSPLLPPSINEG